MSGAPLASCDSVLVTGDIEDSEIPCGTASNGARRRGIAAIPWRDDLESLRCAAAAPEWRGLD
jgi:hypothetical protein